ncbi:MAG: AAA family ATPase [Deltaproteobacteria bacterium]|nr:AAA family ATPase [Deltaproteobacteria bacterium]
MSESDADRKKMVAVCGKGGTGKTASTAMMARVLSESGKAGNLLLIDADPAMGLLSALGVSVQRTMGQVREKIIKTAQKGKEEEKAQLAYDVDYMVFEALNELDEFAILAMGRTETLGCFCPVNNLLRGTIETLSKNFDTILIDGEAGLEQLNRQIVRKLDTLIIVSDPTSRGMETAGLIKKMVEVDHVATCKRLGLVFNRVMGNEELLTRSAEDLGLELFGLVPYDENIASYDLVGKPITDLPENSSGLAAYRDIVAKCIL